MKEELPEEIINRIKESQRCEITEHLIYTRIAESLNKGKNRDILKSIADEELEHYKFWSSITGVEISPNRLNILKYTLLSRLFGFTFAIKLMEKGEEKAQINYQEISEYVPGAEQIIEDEEKHEEELIELLDEERLNYIGSVVLGLNDALVELSGTLAGLTFALQKTELIAVVGIITGIAASLSMGASEYLSTKAEGESEIALNSSLYTGGAYILTVFLLVLPYLLLDNYIICLFLMLGIGIFIIFVFNYYVSIAKDFNFGKRFLEMAFISLGVAAVSFGIGTLIRFAFGIEI